MTQAELMTQGKINGYVVQGFNPLAAFPDKNKSARWRSSNTWW
jgi:formate dehydrogenase major subunit/formate dehydrogenase-N alpha subunit